MNKIYSLLVERMIPFCTKRSNLIKLKVAVICLFACYSVDAQLVVNEVSQGASATKEYIELVVIGNRSCTDSTADLRNWIIDDNNGWLGASSGQGIAQGFMRFPNTATWQKVPYGSIILIYNDGDKNTSITLPDDPTDANHDYVYILPASSTQLEKNIDFPTAPSSTSFVYPTTGISAGGNWNTIGLANNADGVIIVSPTNLTTAYFSFGYGNLNNSSFANVYKPDFGSAKCYYLNDDHYNVSASWNVGAAPAAETPGAPNSTLNANWINSLRQFSSSSVTKDTTTLNGCSSIVYEGTTYNASTMFTDTIKSVAGCDSVYHTVDINIEPLTGISITASGPTTFCLGGSVTLSATISTGSAYTYQWQPGNEVSNAITVNNSGTYTVTVTNAAGCSQTVSQAITKITPVNETNLVHGCGSVLFNGITYTVSTTVQDTTRSVGGCDSIYIATSIRIDGNSTTNVTDSITQGASYTLPSGIVVTSAGNYESILTNSNGCDSIIHTLLKVIPVNNCVLTVPNAFTPNGDSYNDTWRVFDGSCVRRCAVKVYNRYGSLVYRSDNYQNDWRGTYGTKPCPDGTYYYVIEVTYQDNRKHSLKGDVTILR